MELQCFRWFNPESQLQYEEVIGRWVSVFMMLADQVAASVESGRVSTTMPKRQSSTKTRSGLLRGGGSTPSVGNRKKTRVGLSKGEDTMANKATAPSMKQMPEVSFQPVVTSITTATPDLANVYAEADTPEVSLVRTSGVTATPSSHVSMLKSSIYAHIENRVGVMIIAWSWLIILVMGYVLFTIYIRTVRRRETHKRALEGRDVRL
eukprot:8530960-Pyramimonas_sp.AAC.1